MVGNIDDIVRVRKLAEYCECVALSKGVSVKTMTIYKALRIASVDKNIIDLEAWANG